MEYLLSGKLRHTLFFLLMLCFAAAIIGDSTAEALLLARFGPAFIPRMFLVNALVLFALSAWLFSLVDRTDRRTFFFNALLAHGGMLLLLRMAVAAKWDFLYFPLFSYAYSSKILFFLLFWTIANDLIDSRRAGKEFPYIAAGGTIGAIGISFSIPALTRIFPVENLLVVWALLILSASLLLIPLRGRFKNVVRRQGRSESLGKKHSVFHAVSLLKTEPLLRSMSILYFLIFFLLLNQHVAFYTEVREAFISAGAIASFLGKFNGVSMLLTCMLQMGIAGMLLRKMGSTRSMFLLPTALFIVFASLSVAALGFRRNSDVLFWMIITGMGIRVAFFDAFFSPNFQLFFSSLPEQIRGRGKLLIEGIVKPVAMILAGLWLMWIVPKLDLFIHMLLMVVVAAVAIIITIRLKGAYTATLTRYLAGLSRTRGSSLMRQFDLAGHHDVLAFLARKLDHEDFEVQRFIIELIATSPTQKAAELLLSHLEKPDKKLRATITAALGTFPAKMVAQSLMKSLEDTDHRVVANGVLALSQCGADNLQELLRPYLDHPEARVRANVILALWASGRREKRGELFTLLRKMLESGIPHEIASALFAAGTLDDRDVSDLLYAFTEAELEHGFTERGVQHQAMFALSKKHEPAALNLLLKMVQTRHMKGSKLIVTGIGKILPYLDEKVWLRVIENGNALERNCLLHALHYSDCVISSQTREVFSKIAVREMDAIEWEKQSLEILVRSKSEKLALLSFAIREELIALRLDTLLFMIALLDGSGVLFSVLPRIKHTDAHVRARAFEMLENIGDTKINRPLINMIEWFDTLPLPRDVKGAEIKENESLIAHTYYASHNKWVATCAAYVCESGEGIQPLKPHKSKVSD